MVRKRSQREKESLEEIYGIVLIALAVLLGLSIFSQATGIIGVYTVLVLKYAVGAGRYLVPIFLLVWGVAFLLHRARIDIQSVGTGLIISFASIISLVHLAALDSLGIATNKAFQIKLLWEYGGTIGATIAYLLRILLRQGAYVVLSATLIIGLIFCTGVSISRLFSQVVGWAKSLINQLVLKNLFRRKKEAVVDEKQAKSLSVKGVEEEEEEKLAQAETAIMPKFSPTKTTQPKAVTVSKAASQQAYQLPPLSLLKRTTPVKGRTKKTVKESIYILEKTLHNFDVDATVSKVIKGPTVTRFEIQLASGVKVNRLLNLAGDIALALATPDVRILTPIPGKSAVGIEVPNQYRELVTLGDILTTPEAKNTRGVLTIGIGKDITGRPVLANLGEMPHLLIAGATGSGKTICIKGILASILTRARPDQVKMILIDPKRIELNTFIDLPHLITPVVTNAKEAATALKWIVEEMESRFEKLSEAKVRDIDIYNTSLRQTNSQAEPMPYLLVVIDELADLMMISPGEVEDAICRIAQLARAVGIHLVVATQRPSVDIITGLIKANITSRIAFAVSSQIDSRVILDTAGAEKLVGKGDMLFVSSGLLRPQRLQGASITEEELETITKFIRDQANPEYHPEIVRSKKSKFGYDYEDELLDDAIELVVSTGHASASALQRRLRVGYARAARLIDMLEEKGIVGPSQGSKPRAVLIAPEELERINDFEEK